MENEEKSIGKINCPNCEAIGNIYIAQSLSDTIGIEGDIEMITNWDGVVIRCRKCRDLIGFI